MIGRAVRQMRVTLTELNKYIIAASPQTAFLSTYGAGRGLVPQTSPLNNLLALDTGDDESEESGEPSGKQPHPMQECAVSPQILL